MAIIVADTSVLINFLKIDRMDLIGRYPDRFIATDHVAAEITDRFPEQQARYAAALAADYLEEQCVEDLRELELFLHLCQSRRLGLGECSAIAVALNRSFGLAIDDVRAISRALREAGLVGNRLRVLRTQDIMVELIRVGAIDVAAADRIMDEWATSHRFKLKITSFEELL